MERSLLMRSVRMRRRPYLRTSKVFDAARPPSPFHTQTSSTNASDTPVVFRLLFVLSSFILHCSDIVAHTHRSPPPFPHHTSFSIASYLPLFHTYHPPSVSMEVLGYVHVEKRLCYERGLIASDAYARGYTHGRRIALDGVGG